VGGDSGHTTWASERGAMSVTSLYGFSQRYQPAPAGVPGGPQPVQWPNAPLLPSDRRHRNEPDMSRARTVDSGPTGRDAETAEICAFLAAAAGTPSAVAIAGDIGIGKTVVWKHVLLAACAGARVLSCSPAQAESPLAFAALDDLFGGVIKEVIAELPEARRQAVGAVLLHGRSGLPGADPGHPEPEQQLLARGILDVLRVLSADRPLVLAVDNAHWLDRPSAAVLGFCIRRLQHEAVSIVVTLRDEGERGLPGLGRDLPSGAFLHVRLGPLSPGAISQILQSRLGATFGKYTLARLYEACAGNPFYALESARALLERGHTCPAGEPLPVPDVLGDLVRHRVRGMTGDTLRIGRLIAASADPREHVILAAHGGQESWVALDKAIDDGIIERDGDALRFTHCLLRPVLYGEMTRGERRDVHRLLAAHAGETAERAWHLALSAEGPSDEIAATLDAAAERAAAGGEPVTAAVLEEQAVRLTPSAQARQRRDRALRAGDYHFRAGELTRSRELIESALASWPADAGRAALLIRLAAIHYHRSGWARAEQTLGQALAQAPHDPELRAHAEQDLAVTQLTAGDLAAASHWAEASLRSAGRAARPGLVAQSLARVAMVEFLQGNGIRADLLDQAEGLAEAPDECPSMLSPSLARAVILKWGDRLAEARLRFADGYRQAAGRGDQVSLPFLLYHFSELECWAGNWDAAAEYARKAGQLASENQQRSMKPAALYALALILAHRGHTDHATELAAEALTACERSGNIALRSSVLSVLGFIAVSLGDHQAAHTHLGDAAKAAAGAGLAEPCLARFLPDEIEALAVLGQASLARSYAEVLQERGRSLDRPWALATAARCRAHLASVEGDHDGAQAACNEALAAHDRLPMPFELGRTLLVKGMIERRARRKSAAAASFGRALATFEHLGAPLWAGKARQELTGTAARPLAGGLTPTEHRVADLIAQGRSNREVARVMFVTENTVQTHARHIFQKLGVRSRTELAARFLAASS
jgi:DNA-binding CsgD family transcriptional regulator/tetratricopeptide (TPR) repeat protein